jgi:hypothetical protein
MDLGTVRVANHPERSEYGTPVGKAVRWLVYGIYMSRQNDWGHAEVKVVLRPTEYPDIDTGQDY